MAGRALPSIADSCSAQRHVRYGSKADICSAPTHVRFTPNSDRKSRHAQMVMSALPLKADMCGASRDVRFGPIADIGFLFDHVVGLRKQRWWDRYAERPSPLEIYHQLVLGWSLHGKISGLLAFEDAINVTRGAAVLVDKINAIGDQSAVGDIKSVGNDRRKFVLGREHIDQFAIRNCQCAPRYNQTAIWLACERGDSAFSLGRVAHIDWSHVHPE